MDRAELPLIAPQYEPRYISAADVVALVNRGKVQGVNYDDARIQEIRECILGPVGGTDFKHALQVGYLNVSYRNTSLDAYIPAVETAWRWWCTAAGHPHIVMSPDGQGYRRVQCNLISTGRRWRPVDMPHFERILGEVSVYDRSEYEISLDQRMFTIDGLGGDDAVMIARNLVDYTTAGTFRERPLDELPEPDPHGILVRPHVPIDRLR